MRGLFTEVAACWRQAETPRDSEMNVPTLWHVVGAVSKQLDGLEGRQPGHAIRLASLTLYFCEALGLSKKQQAALVSAAFLHEMPWLTRLSEVLQLLPLGWTSRRLLYAQSLPPSHNDARIPAPIFSQLLEPQPIIWPGSLSVLNLPNEVERLVNQSHYWLLQAKARRSADPPKPVSMEVGILVFSNWLESLVGTVSGLQSRVQLANAWLNKQGESLGLPSALIQSARHLLSEEAFLPQSPFSSLFGPHMEANLLKRLFHLKADWSEPLEPDTLLEVSKALAAFSESFLGSRERGGQLKVADIAYKLAEALDCMPKQRGELLIAALWSGSGRLALPVEVHQSTGRLASRDLSWVEQWPLINEHATKTIPGFDNVALWSSECLERLNGKGRPYGKTHNELSPGGRILALATAYVALTSSRAYRAQAYSTAEALTVLERERGFDPALLRLLRQLTLHQQPLEKPEKASVNRSQAVASSSRSRQTA